MISFFVRLPYISINYMEARTQLCISQKLSLMEPRHMKKYTNGDRGIFRNTIDFYEG